MKRSFKPEFLNRIDDIIMFNPLTKEQLSSIIDLLFKEIQERLQDRQITISLTDAAKQFIADESYEPELGARPVKRYLQRNIETLIGKELIKGTITDGSNVNLDVKDGKIVIA